MAQPLATQSPHLDILSNAIPSWLGTASAAKRAVLAEGTPAIADWYLSATEQQHAHLKQLNAAAWTAQNRVDKALAALQRPEIFGAARLQAALKDEFGVDADVRTTYLQLYVPLTLAGFTVKPGAARTWSVSLLDAALHNFETDEPYEQHSGFSTQPTPTGQFTPCRPWMRRSASPSSPNCAAAWISARLTNAIWMNTWTWTIPWPAPAWNTGSNKATWGHCNWRCTWPC